MRLVAINKASAEWLEPRAEEYKTVSSLANTYVVIRTIKSQHDDSFQYLIVASLTTVGRIVKEGKLWRAVKAEIVFGDELEEDLYAELGIEMVAPRLSDFTPLMLAQYEIQARQALNKKPLTDSKRRKRADEKKRAAGFLKVANHWVHGSRREEALEAVASELKKAKYQEAK